MMAASDDPFVPSPVSDIHTPEFHQHHVPIVNIEDKDRETLEYDPPEDVKIDEGVLLELDEADALFNKRGGVKDSHKRY
jgi:hypothetical protein